MLGQKDTEKRGQMKILCIEDLVPKNHLLRKVDRVIDFSFVRNEVKDLYSNDTGRPSIDPVVLIKLCIINYMFGLNSMRRTIRECEVNIAYRWFIGYDLMEEIPHFSTFGKNYKLRFEGTKIFEKIFARVISQAMQYKLLDTSAIFVDGTHIKANANSKKYIKEQVLKSQAKHYSKKILAEINDEREEDDKKPFDDQDKLEEKTEIKSKTDPESGVFHKGEHKKCFAYSANTACDKNNFVIGVNVVPGNVNDSVSFDKLYEEIKQKYKIDNVVMDAGYKTPWICKQLLDDNKLPITPYKRPMTKEGFFKKYEYVYDEKYDCYICPNEKILRYATTNRDGYREYRSNKNDCEKCPLINKCTHSKQKQKVILRHIWSNYLDIAEDIRHTALGRELYTKRSEKIERVFADAKEKYGMRYTRLKGLNKVKTQVLLTFTCMNIKKMINKLGNLIEDISLFMRKTTIFSKLFTNFSTKSKRQPIFSL